MLGIRSVIALSLAAAAILGCRKVPTAALQPVAPPVNIVLPDRERLGEESTLERVLAAYEWEPTGDRAVDVWTAFAAVDTRLATLQEEVARRVGGARAEAEIERIELQRVRDEQMERFARTQARIRQARIAFNNLAASINRREGVRAAASMINRGLRSDTRTWKSPGLRDLHSHLRTP